jgi:hypothetical protein
MARWLPLLEWMIYLTISKELLHHIADVALVSHSAYRLAIHVSYCSYRTLNASVGRREVDEAIAILVA